MKSPRRLRLRLQLWLRLMDLLGVLGLRGLQRSAYSTAGVPVKTFILRRPM